MKILLSTLEQYTGDLPQSEHACREFLDDIGIEVKNWNKTPQGPVVTVELLANRGDHHAYLGIAREIAGKLQSDVMFPDWSAVEVTTDAHFQIETDACLMYSLSPFELTPHQPLPDWIQNTLRVSEEETGIPIVDLANFVGLELGQPLHVFDAEKVQGPITVRLSGQGETAHLLFHDAPQIIPENTVVICDSQQILALGGIMGCVGAAVTEKTEKILIESALFDPISIRTQARALKLSTQASIRFERGGDPSLVITAIGRMKYWIERAFKGRALGKTSLQEVHVPPGKRFQLNLSEVRRYFAMPLEPSEIQKRLEAYAFVVQIEQNSEDTLFFVDVPPHRLWDIQTEACLLEELSKSIGYNALPAEMPPNTIGTSVPASYHKERSVATLLVHAGFDEVILDSFYGVHSLAKIQPHPTDHLHEHVQIINSIDKAFSLLKNNAWLQALELLADNQRYGLFNIKVFEFTRLFFPEAKARGKEQPILWGMVNGQTDKHWNAPSQSHHLWGIKGLLQHVFESLDHPIRFEPGSSAYPVSADLHPLRQASLWIGHRLVGIMGQMHPRLVNPFDLKFKEPLYFEIDGLIFSDPIYDANPQTFKEPPEYSAIKRALAFHVPVGIETERLIQVMKERAPAWIREITVIDYFESVVQSEMLRAFTFEIEFENNNNQSAETINLVLEELRSHVLHVFSESGVKARV